MVFEITATDVGVFEVAVKFSGIQAEKVEVVFQVNINNLPAYSMPCR